MEERGIFGPVGENVNWCSHCEKEYGVSKTTVQSKSSTSEYLSEENKNTDSKRCIYALICSLHIYL